MSITSNEFKSFKPFNNNIPIVDSDRQKQIELGLNTELNGKYAGFTPHVYGKKIFTGSSNPLEIGILNDIKNTKTAIENKSKPLVVSPDFKTYLQSKGYVGSGTKPLEVIPNPVVTKKPLDALTKATNTANIINGVNAAVGGGLALYGLAQVDKMKAPTSLQAPTIEAKLIRDRGAAIATANKGEIDTQLNTAREGLLRRGRTDMLPSLVGKGMSAMNQSSAQIEQLRMGIEQANAGAENRVREINANSKMQAGQFNSQIGQQFNQFKAQLSGSVLSAGIQNVSANLSGIAQNNYAAAMYKSEQEYKADMLKQIGLQSRLL